jgi:hypothetical protein
MNRADVSMMNTDNPSLHRADKVKYLYFANDPEIRNVEYIPYFYAEVRIDFNDVRTGLRETFSLNRAMEIYPPQADLFWVHDMVHDVDLQKLTSSAPVGVRFSSLPAYVDVNFIAHMETQFIQYLLCSFATKLCRNSVLNVYSNSGESQSDFIERCRELFAGPMRRELDLLHDVYNRRIEQLKEKYLASGEPIGLEQARIESQNKDIFSSYSDLIAELFLSIRFASGRSIEPFGISPDMMDLEERLAALGIEAQKAIAQITSVYEDKARALDEYILHPNLKDIHFVRSCILWMPKRAA